MKLVREKTNLQVALQAVLQIFKYSAPYPRSFIPTILRRYGVPFLLLRIKERNDHFVFIFMCPNIVLTYSCSYYRLYVAYFTWLHQLQQLPASPPVSTRCGLQRFARETLSSLVSSTLPGTSLAMSVRASW